jgi:hypothetical protein
LLFNNFFCAESLGSTQENAFNVQSTQKNDLKVQTSPQVITYLMPTDCGLENQNTRLECVSSRQEVKILECGCPAEACCCCLDCKDLEEEVAVLECGCVSEELCCCSECDLSAHEFKCSPEDLCTAFQLNSFLQDCAISDCVCVSKGQYHCFECIKANQKVILDSVNHVLSREGSILESNRTKSELITLKNALEDIDEFDRVLVIGEANGLPGIVQKVKYVQTNEYDLKNLFKNLKIESEQVTKFYDYYDVLTYIDKSIAHINEFLDTFTFNISNNSLLLKKYIERVFPDFEKYDKLANEIECMLKRHHKTVNESEIIAIEEELTSINKRIAYLKEQYDRYKVFRIRDYQYYNTMKFHKLTRLLKDLKNVRCKMLSMKEGDIKRKAKYFKESFKTTVSKIYDNLCKCKEKERRILNFLFEVLEDIWVGTGKYLDKLESFKLVLLEIPCLIPTFDE